MLMAGGGASDFSFHLPMRGFLSSMSAARTADAVANAASTARTATHVRASRFSICDLPPGRIQSTAMVRTVVALLSLVALPSSAFATWSVVAVDRTTNRVVIASATCVDQNDEFLKGVQAVVVPGKGVAACQAAVDSTHANQMLVYGELQKGTDPKAIIELLSKDPAFQSRQFGILDLQGRRAGHSGRSE